VGGGGPGGISLRKVGCVNNYFIPAYAACAACVF
jgi:hypothetical protein